MIFVRPKTFVRKTTRERGRIFFFFVRLLFCKRWYQKAFWRGNNINWLQRRRNRRGSSSINAQGSKGREAINTRDGYYKRGSRLPGRPRQTSPTADAFRSRYSSDVYTVHSVARAFRFRRRRRYPLHRRGAII